MVGDVYSGDRLQAWSADGVFDHNLMLSMDAEEVTLFTAGTQGTG